MSYLPTQSIKDNKLVWIWYNPTTKLRTLLENEITETKSSSCGKFSNLERLTSFGLIYQIRDEPDSFQFSLEDPQKLINMQGAEKPEVLASMLKYFFHDFYDELVDTNGFTRIPENILAIPAGTVVEVPEKTVLGKRYHHGRERGYFIYRYYVYRKEINHWVEGYERTDKPEVSGDNLYNSLYKKWL